MVSTLRFNQRNGRPRRKNYTLSIRTGQFNMVVFDFYLDNVLDCSDNAKVRFECKRVKFKNHCRPFNRHVEGVKKVRFPSTKLNTKRARTF